MDPILGMIVLFPMNPMFNERPRGWLPCDGRLLSIQQYQAMYALLGTQHGGDGRTTFALPNLPAPAAGLQYKIAVEGMFPDSW